MFDPSDHPRLFGLAPGVPFAQALVAGLAARSDDLSRVRLYVNSARMLRQVRAAFAEGPARLLPRIRLVTDLSLEGRIDALKPAVSPLRRRLELSRAVERLIDATGDLPRAQLYDLSDSLATLMDEMHVEGVGFDRLAELDVTDVSGHWRRALRFLQLLEPYFDADADTPDAAARQRAQVLALIDTWTDTPPQDPVILAGSTGSRGATGLFLQAVARLPQGAVVLPGFDFDLPEGVWSSMDAIRSRPDQEDHPQFRYRKILREMDLPATAVRPWSEAEAPSPARNRLISLSLRPAPVTDQWRRDGEGLGPLEPATTGITLLEAPNPRAEAEAIALGLRQAAASGRTAALISPDRNLTRQVAAALDRWDIVPDDSAGVPLNLSPPGRMLLMIAEAFGAEVHASQLIALLEHPLAHTGTDGRGPHLLRLRNLQLHLRRKGLPSLTPEWLETYGEHRDWARWLAEVLRALRHEGRHPLGQHQARLMQAATLIAGGPEGRDTGGLFDQDAGRKALAVCEAIAREADAAGPMGPRDFAVILGAQLAQKSVRDRDAGRPDIVILGTLEARVGGSDLVILAGLNDGIWPPVAPPDSWLNRTLRARAGLPLPDRQTGLSAHDYQQAVAAPEVWLTRSLRDADAQTVPSRWVNRLTNLLGGLTGTGGPAALAEMRARGQVWLRRSEALDRPQVPVPKASRPAPNPPVEARPRRISVTQIKTLFRDPYAIYARAILRLRPLDPLMQDPGPAMKGIVFHAVLERFLRPAPDLDDPGAVAAFLDVADAILAERCPWPAIRMRWRTELAALAEPFLAAERRRQADTRIAALETTGKIEVGATGVWLVGQADRIDLGSDGRAWIYDYKTGTLPTLKQQRAFDRQLLAEAAMIERGAFGDIGEVPVAGAAFLSLKPDLKSVPAPLDTHPTSRTWDELQQFLAEWFLARKPMPARRAPKFMGDYNDFDHLSRRGEWTDSDSPEPEDLT